MRAQNVEQADPEAHAPGGPVDPGGLSLLKLGMLNTDTSTLPASAARPINGGTSPSPAASPAPKTKPRHAVVIALAYAINRLRSGGAEPSLTAAVPPTLSDGHWPSTMRHRMVTGMAITSITALRIVNGSPNKSW